MRKAKPKPFTRKAPPRTPLLNILRLLANPKRRDEFARLAGTSQNYLYQLGTCARTSCRIGLAKSIADASLVMARKYGTPVLTLEEVASMCGGEGCGK